MEEISVDICGLAAGLFLTGVAHLAGHVFLPSFSRFHFAAKHGHVA